MDDVILSSLFLIAMIVGLIITFFSKQARNKKLVSARLAIMLICLLVAGLARISDPNLVRTYSSVLYHLLGLFGFSVGLLWLSWRANSRMNAILAKRAKILEKRKGEANASH